MEVPLGENGGEGSRRGQGRRSRRRNRRNEIGSGRTVEQEQDEDEQEEVMTTTLPMSLLDRVGIEMMGIVVPVSICMLLVVLLVRRLTPHGADVSIQSVATLVYTERPTDTTSQKLEGALLNSLVFVATITMVTFFLVLMYYYRCIKFLKYYMCASAAFVLAYMGGAVFFELIHSWSVPLDVITALFLLVNFTVVGVMSVFMSGMPIIITQFYLIMIGMLVAFWFTMLPEWTTWVLLVAMALYDLVAVLAPGGPLKLLVELAMSRDEQIPALIYEARPLSLSSNANSHSETGTVLSSITSRQWRYSNRSASEEVNVSSTELQPWVVPTGNRQGSESVSMERPQPSISFASVLVNQQDTSSANPEYKADEEEAESLPLISGQGTERLTSIQIQRHGHEAEVLINDGVDDIGLSTSGAIKLGLGDFVFYSLLVGRAAMYDLMTVYACYLAIIAGLGSTLILLAVARRALPALPISICLGVTVYFLTRLLMEPLIVGISTSLVIF